MVALTDNWAGYRCRCKNGSPPWKMDVPTRSNRHHNPLLATVLADVDTPSLIAERNFNLTIKEEFASFYKVKGPDKNYFWFPDALDLAWVPPENIPAEERTTHYC